MPSGLGRAVWKDVVQVPVQTIPSSIPEGHPIAAMANAKAPQNPKPYNPETLNY